MRCCFVFVLLPWLEQKYAFCINFFCNEKVYVNKGAY